MKKFAFISLVVLLLSTLPVILLLANDVKEKDKVTIHLTDGTLTITPLSENAVRIQFYKTKLSSFPEFIFEEKTTIPQYSLIDSEKTLKVTLKNITTEINKTSGIVRFYDGNNNLILQEVVGSRLLKPHSIKGDSCYMIEQSFESPGDEFILGLGQFQDGHFNIKSISRRLTQVNSQIAIPFIYSSKGYGLLWHQYGMTDYNPADNIISLQRQQINFENEKTAEVTTTSGTHKVFQNQSLYTGKFSVTQNGEYSVFLDLGDMGNRHYIAIDGKPVVDISNFWLPPTISVLVKLTAGEHYVEVICKSDNKPTLSWKLKDNYTTFRSPHSKLIDYVVFYGPSADSVIATYRKLSGKAPLFPIWAYGFWQCRERYTSSTHLVETVQEFRKRNLPMDVIVQDWQYWGNNGWGVPKFDETHYPNPSDFIKKIHDLNARFVISVWSNPDKNSDIGKYFQTNNLFIPNTKWLDYYNPETRKQYWNTLKENLFRYGVDGWWMDAVEPENDALKDQKIYIGDGNLYRLTYPLFACQAIYEGQKNTIADKRVCILTRSAFLGQQRYGIINWSGDIGGTWDSYRRQIMAGLNYSISGLPYWTTDIGGFFRPGNSQYIDEKYHELLIRWFQWGAFCPVFRVHAYMTETEPWKYGQRVEDIMRKYLNLRYQLLPYIYSEAWQTTQNGSTIMRPLVMDFGGDLEALNQKYEYMFGKSLLVAPVTQAGTGKTQVYLPKGTDWSDFWTDQRYEGGKTINKETPLDIIPLYIKAGSILPIGPKVQYATERKWDTLEIRIYEGANSTFTLYEDEGDNYNYEKGMYSTIEFKWDNTAKTLKIGKRQGNFPGMLITRTFSVLIVSSTIGIKTETTNEIKKIVKYDGEKKIITLE